MFMDTQIESFVSERFSYWMEHVTKIESFLDGLVAQINQNAQKGHIGTSTDKYINILKQYKDILDLLRRLFLDVGSTLSRDEKMLLNVYRNLSLDDRKIFLKALGGSND